MASKKILRYLKGTKHFSLNYLKGNFGVESYADADYACGWDRKPSSGLVFLSQGGANSSERLKQRLVHY